MMPRIPALLAAPAVLLSLAGCQTTYEDAVTQIGSAAIMDRSGAAVGTARLYALGEEVTLNASFSGLTSGQHAVHLHMTGDCSADDFTSAGGHLNPDGRRHGTESPGGAHLGDLPNVRIDIDGRGTMSTVLRGMLSDIESDIFDADGTAIIVHAGADDYRTDPAGDAGRRIACGLVTRS